MPLQQGETVLSVQTAVFFDVTLKRRARAQFDALAYVSKDSALSHDRHTHTRTERPISNPVYSRDSKRLFARVS